MSLGGVITTYSQELNATGRARLSNVRGRQGNYSGNVDVRLSNRGYTQQCLILDWADKLTTCQVAADGMKHGIERARAEMSAGDATNSLQAADQNSAGQASSAGF